MKQLKIPSSVFLTTAAEFYKTSLNELKGKNVVLFTSSSNAKRLSLLHWIELLSENCSLTWIDKIPSNPTYVDVYNTLSKIRNRDIDVVIAIGGGSTIDMAKACVGLNYLNANAMLSKNDVLHCIKTKDYLEHPSDIPIYAVPTTAGTGSEVTQWATVWDMHEKAKYSVDAAFLCPKRAYIIPEYTVTMPKRLTLSTGLDALCQAVEAYWAKSTNCMVKELSKTAMKLIVEYLPKVLSEPECLYYREKVCLGSLFSGLAFSNTRTTACHSISYPLTMIFGIEHGIACALSLTKVFEINLPAIEEVDELFDALGVSSTDELQEWLDKTASGIIDLRLSSFGIQEKDIPRIAELSFTLGRMDNNPVEITYDTVKDILMDVL